MPVHNNSFNKKIVAVGEQIQTLATDTADEMPFAGAYRPSNFPTKRREQT